MNNHILSSGALVLLLAAKASAQAYGDLMIPLKLTFMAGSNLFNNPESSYSNNISYLFNATYAQNAPPSPPPEGTTVSLWNPTTSSFDTTSTFTNGAWTIDLMLPSGAGALVVTPSTFFIDYIGYVTDHDGNFISNNADLFLPPPVFLGPNGTYLLGDKAPIVDVGTNIFLNIIGRIPFVGEQVTQLSGTSTFLGNGMWDSVPTLEVGEAALLNIMTEPSPQLTIVYTNNEAIISWPSTRSVWTLQTNNNLATGAWGNYIGPIINNTVTNSPSAGNAFFRLSYP